MDYTQTIGNVNELRCMLAIMQLGHDCSIPYGNASKYDFIADINGELLRFQCKSSHYVIDHGVTKKDAFQFSTSCQTTNTKETRRYRYNSEQIDYFITSFEGKVYVVPVQECSTSKTLRLSAPNNGAEDWNNAADYLVEKYFSHSDHYTTSKETYLNRNVCKNTQTFFCENCGKVVSYGKNLCSTCASIKSRKVERPDRDKLKELIRNNSFIEVGKMYKVSDNTIRKWCASYNLPNKSREIQKIKDKDWLNI